MQATIVFKFNKSADISQWRIVDDVVMGGRSDGNFSINQNGHGCFEGVVSLENNGGFSSVRYRFDAMNVVPKSTVILKVKGDGKDYQFRLKEDVSSYYSYITTFSTSGEWEEITISLSDLYPSFRGRKLDMPNFNHSVMEELSFLIANKKAEKFQLLIESIELK